MNYPSFCDTLKNFLIAELPEGSTVDFDQIRKNNGIRLDALHATIPGHSCNPLFYPQALYEAYQGGHSMEEILTALQSLVQDTPPFPEEFIDTIQNFDQVRGMISFRLISLEKNEELLKEIPYIPLLDLAIVFFLTLECSEDNHTTTLIHRNQMEKWNISPETLWHCAQSNSPVLYPAMIRSLEDMVFHSFCNTSEIPPIKPEPEEPFPLYVLTNTSSLFGAAVMLYPGILKDLAEKWGYDLLILPSSIHEVLVLPDNDTYDYSSLKEMVETVNRESIPEEDCLTDSLYLYRRDGEKLILWQPDDSPHTSVPGGK